MVVFFILSTTRGRALRENEEESLRVELAESKAIPCEESIGTKPSPCAPATHAQRRQGQSTVWHGQPVLVREEKIAGASRTVDRHPTAGC